MWFLKVTSGWLSYPKVRRTEIGGRMFHVKHSRAVRWPWRAGLGDISSVCRVLRGLTKIGRERRVSSSEHQVDVSRETSILDDLRKTVLNGRGLDRCRGPVTQEEAHGGRQYDEDLRRSQSEGWSR